MNANVAAWLARSTRLPSRSTHSVARSRSSSVGRSSARLVTVKRSRSSLAMTGRAAPEVEFTGAQENEGGAVSSRCASRSSAFVLIATTTSSGQSPTSVAGLGDTESVTTGTSALAGGDRWRRWSGRRRRRSDNADARGRRTAGAPRAAVERPDNPRPRERRGEGEEHPRCRALHAPSIRKGKSKSSHAAFEIWAMSGIASHAPSDIVAAYEGEVEARDRARNLSCAAPPLPFR